MESLGQQFTRKMQNRASKERFTNIAKDVANQMIEIAQKNTRKGTTIRGGEYDSRYAPSTKDRKKKTDPVTLRDKELSVEKMRAEKEGTKAGIRGRKRLKDHNEGINYSGVGRRRRQMFPETNKQMPKTLTQYMKRQVEKLLTGSYDK